MHNETAPLVYLLRLDIGCDTFMFDTQVYVPMHAAQTVHRLLQVKAPHKYPRSVLTTFNTQSCRDCTGAAPSIWRPRRLLATTAARLLFSPGLCNSNFGRQEKRFLRMSCLTSRRQRRSSLLSIPHPP